SAAAPARVISACSTRRRRKRRRRASISFDTSPSRWRASRSSSSIRATRPIAARATAAPYAAEFMGMRPPPGSWLLTHRPVWGFRSHRKTINATLQQALAAFDGALPDGIALALAGLWPLRPSLRFRDVRARAGALHRDLPRQRRQHAVRLQAQAG